MLAYVIKGYIIILKKIYENFSREINQFIEIHLKIRVKPKRENESKEKPLEDNKDKNCINKTSLVSLNNFSLLSDLSQNDLSGFSSDLAKQFLSTIRKMKKKNNSTLKSLYEGVEKNEKLEILVKNFSENVKKSQDLFNSSLLHVDTFENNNFLNICQENENLFSNYLNFSINLENKSLKSDEKDKTKQIFNTDQEENEPPIQPPLSQEYSILGLDENKKSILLTKLGLLKELNEKKISYYKFDKEINLTPEEIVEYLEEAQKLVILEQDNEINNKNMTEASRDNVYHKII